MTTQIHYCQCESSRCEHHSTASCVNQSTVELKTIYGTYKMCVTCATNMPSTYLHSAEQEEALGRSLKDKLIGHHSGTTGSQPKDFKSAAKTDYARCRCGEVIQRPDGYRNWFHVDTGNHFCAQRTVLSPAQPNDDEMTLRELEGRQ